MMKNILLALIVFCAVNLIGQNKVVNQTIYNIEPFIQVSLKSFDIDSIIVNLQPVKGLVLGQYMAVTVRNDTYLYTVAISSSIDYDKTIEVLAEEISHIYQMHKCGLVMTDKKVVSNGKSYGLQSDKWSANYEIEARKLAEHLIEVYRNSKYTTSL